MEINEMTKEQLIDQINILKGQILEFKAARDRYKKVESTLRASDKKFRFFFNTAPIGLVISNFQGDIINTNKTIQELVGYTPEEAKK
ncbi:MAG: PAS domain-containing protein [Clostridia bacterium]|jgi:PAS domain-containing protein